MPDPKNPPAATTTTTSDFNITLQLGKDPGTPVTIYAQDLANIATNGLHFKLPDGDPVPIGSLKDFIDWLNSTFSAGLPDAASDDWPSSIKDIFNGILSVKISVTQLTIDQDPKTKDGKWPDPEFSLAVTGTTTTPFAIIPGITALKVVGGGVGVTRTNTPPAS
jgi:hypothetical protein